MHTLTWAFFLLQKRMKHTQNTSKYKISMSTIQIRSAIFVGVRKFDHLLSTASISTILKKSTTTFN